MDFTVILHLSVEPKLNNSKYFNFFCEKAKGLTASDNQAECKQVLLSHSVCVTCVMSAENDVLYYQR